MCSWKFDHGKHIAMVQRKHFFTIAYSRKTSSSWRMYISIPIWKGLDILILTVSATIESMSVWSSNSCTDAGHVLPIKLNLLWRVTQYHVIEDLNQLIDVILFTIIMMFLMVVIHNLSVNKRHFIKIILKCWSTRFTKVSIML